MRDREKGVALRKESVDRNIEKEDNLSHDGKSLSARRAWIEILLPANETLFTTSLSARRAWIEIFQTAGQTLPLSVALRKESVDRNRGVLAPLAVTP